MSTARRISKRSNRRFRHTTPTRRTCSEMASLFLSHRIPVADAQSGGSLRNTLLVICLLGTHRRSFGTGVLEELWQPNTALLTWNGVSPPSYVKITPPSSRTGACPGTETASLEADQRAWPQGLSVCLDRKPLVSLPLFYGVVIMPPRAESAGLLEGCSQRAYTSIPEPSHATRLQITHLTQLSSDIITIIDNNKCIISDETA